MSTFGYFAVYGNIDLEVCIPDYILLTKFSSRSIKMPNRRRPICNLLDETVSANSGFIIIGREYVFLAGQKRENQEG